MPWIGSTSMFGMLRAASAKLASTSAPSMMSALVRPSLAKFFCKALVLPSFTVALSSTTMPPSLALADSACLRASARTFFGRSMAWLRGVGPNDRPPPRNRLTRAEPWRADPVPFCLYIFLPVRWISARFLTSCVPRWRLASCQTMQRWMRSARGVSPKISSDTVTEPAASPARVVTVSSMSRALLSRFRGGGRRARRNCRRGCALGRRAEFAGFGGILGKRLLDRVPHHDPATLGAGHRSFNQNEAPLDVGLNHAQIEGGDPLDAEMSGHLFVLEGFAGVLTAAGTADRAMRDRDAVRCAQASEVPALHAARK